jgi:hypothetical protein
LIWHDGAGNGVRKVSPPNLDNAITTVNIIQSNGNILNAITQPFTYSITGNIIHRDYVTKNGPINPNTVPTQTGTVNDINTILYSDSHNTFGTNTSVITQGTTVTTRVASNSSIQLTPLLQSMAAGKTVTHEAPGCPGGISTNVYSVDGQTVTNLNCGGEIRTNVPLSDTPGIIQSTSNGGTNPDHSVILVGLDGPSIAPGSTFVVLTLNRGLNPDGSHSFPAYTRMKILAVN